MRQSRSPQSPGSLEDILYNEFVGLYSIKTGGFVRKCGCYGKPNWMALFDENFLSIKKLFSLFRFHRDKRGQPFQLRGQKDLHTLYSNCEMFDHTSVLETPISLNPRSPSLEKVLMTVHALQTHYPKSMIWYHRVGAVPGEHHNRCWSRTIHTTDQSHVFVMSTLCDWGQRLQKCYITLQ